MITCKVLVLVIDYRIYVIIYSASPSINSKHHKHNHLQFLLRNEPFSPKFQNHITSSFLNQITSHKAQNSSFFILFHLHQSKLTKNPSNGRTIKEAKGRFNFICSHQNSMSRIIQGEDNPNSSLQIISYIVFLGRTMYPVQFPFLFSFHYRP